MSDNEPDLQLLLTDAEEYMPVLEDGLPSDALGQTPTASRGPRGADAMHLDAPHVDSNILSAQRWGVIAPIGERGDAMLKAVDELIQHRRDQQGAKPKIYRVPPDMDALTCLKWKNDVHRAEDVPEDERPRYLMMLGDLHEVSLELQHVLANGAFVGRVQCPDSRGFTAYARKVVSREKSEPTDESKLLYYTVQDGTAAVELGYRRLVEPCMFMTGDWVSKGKLSIAGHEEIPSTDMDPEDMIESAGKKEHAVMLSLGHGLGAPRKGWKSVDHQHALQGALSMGMEEPLTADALRETPFLPGGIWMCVACFAAGTPPTSAFHSWLQLLASEGATSPTRIREVLKSLPKPGERPFVAALPQAVLANPNGPLAVIGHMDLAWTFGFTAPGSKKSRASRIFSTLRVLLEGSRSGIALDALMRVYRETNDDLMNRYQLQRDAQVQGQPDPIDAKLLGNLWMQRNDLRGYVLLGDPAARLSLPSTAMALRQTPGASQPIVVNTQPPQTPEASQPIVVNTQPPQPPEQQTPVETSSRDTPPYHASSRVSATKSSTPSAANPRAEDSGTTRAERPVVSAQPAQDQATTPSPPVGPPPPTAQPFVAPVPPTYGVSMTIQPSSPPAGHAPPPTGPMAPPPSGAAPLGAVTRPQTLSNPQIALRERAVLAMIRGDEAPRSIAMRFGLPLEELFYWLDVYREAGRRALAG